MTNHSIILHKTTARYAPDTVCGFLTRRILETQHKGTIAVPNVGFSKNDIFQGCHVAPYSGHVRISKTLKMIQNVSGGHT